MGSGFLRLDIADFGKGILMAFLGAFLNALYQYFPSGPIENVNWKVCLATGISAAVAYLLKNFFTNSQNKLLRLEPKKLS